MQHLHTNKLAGETSPYLLQHAHNPVNWFPWGEEALSAAKTADMVILVSIGYAACHWCHVMERESFEDIATAEIMNKYFINIKIDREERPDIDHIYMDAVQAMSGSGGWPLNVFLTPAGKPFFGGTYFPPVRAFNRGSWKEVLYGVAKAWQERREEIETQAETLTGHIRQSNNFAVSPVLIPGSQDAAPFSKDQCHLMFDQVMKMADKEWGGFGKAPKFPQTFTISYLLQYHHFTGTKEALQQALLSLDKMLQGGIYDQAGGGFSRYSTDNEWLAPHFEKMLYDNALLTGLLSDAYAVTKKPGYERAIRDTIAFIQREMTQGQGGFYSALDADSEGEEGKFYVWSQAEINELLGEDAALFCRYFDISETGNWEGKNILRAPEPMDRFAEKNSLDPASFAGLINRCLPVLLAERSKRIRPATDDKILLGWNALMITALCKASAVLNDEHFKNTAENCFEFIWNKLNNKGHEFFHTWKNDTAKYPAFLDDYACLIQCCIQLQEITSDTHYLDKAAALTRFVLENFADNDSPFFFYTGHQQTDVIVRKKEIYDGATPSGNSIMAENLAYLGIVFDERQWVQRAQQMMAGIKEAVVKHPSSFGVWASCLLKQVVEYNEIAVVGPGFEAARAVLLENYLPNRILQCTATAGSAFPLLAGKSPGGGLQVFLCKNYICSAPETTAGRVLELIRRNDNF